MMDQRAQHYKRAIRSAAAKRLAIRFLGVLLVSGAAGACTIAGPADAAIDPVVAHACGVTMGLDRYTEEYSDCVDGLEDAKAGVRRAKVSQQEWAACSAKGLQQGTSGYALCVLGQEQPLATGAIGDVK